VGTARVERRARDVVRRIRPGDIAVIDHLDLDRDTAQALVDAGAVAVVDAAAIISGRFPNLGPQVLVEAGLVVLDAVGAQALGRIGDGTRIRLHDGAVFVGDAEVARGRMLDAEAVATEMAAARAGLVNQLASLTHNSVELLRREEDLLLHGRGVPRLSTRLEGRPVVVVGPGGDLAAELAAVRGFLREQRPVLVAVGAAADALKAAGLRPDVVVVDSGEELPTAATLKAAGDVVLRVDRGSASALGDQLERLGVRPLLCETSVAVEDAALVLVDAADPAVIVAVGFRATLEDLLDRQRPGLAGAYLTRWNFGPRLVDGAAVPHLYSGRVRAWHLVAVLLAGLVALAAAVSVTPVGNEWADSLPASLSDLFDQAQGLFS
jgi:uncharacterized membrane-anchored protein